MSSQVEAYKESISGIFAATLKLLRASDIEPVKQAATIFEENIRAEKVMVSIGKDPPDVSGDPLISFEQISLPGLYSEHSLVGLIMIDIEKYINKVSPTDDNSWKNPYYFVSEFVRTMGVANQFPVSGFERRLKVVYGDAFDLQEAWLNGKRVSIPADPREVNREDLFETIVGKNRALTDTGWSDYLRATELVCNGLPDPEKRKLLSTCTKESQKPRFVILRERIAKQVALTALLEDKKGFLSWGNDERALYTAVNIIGVVLKKQAKEPS